MPKDVSKAVSLYLLGAEKGDLRAKLYYAHHLLDEGQTEDDAASKKNNRN